LVGMTCIQGSSISFLLGNWMGRKRRDCFREWKRGDHTSLDDTYESHCCVKSTWDTAMKLLIWGKRSIPLLLRRRIVCLPRPGPILLQAIADPFQDIDHVPPNRGQELPALKR